MASKRPLLILQMQRMGDVLLTFPLLLWLARQYPGHPLWVVAESQFFTPLMPLSPHAAYIDWRQAQGLASNQFHLIINLSHRPEAAELAGRLCADAVLGPVRSASGHTYIHGPWQLYRASLVHNNRHNRFHWAELHALDVIHPRMIGATALPEPRTLPENKTVGLFLGASEPAKRPTAAFWAALVRECVKREMKPLLLGGPGDVPLGKEVEQLAGAPSINLCGRFDLAAFARMGQTLGLMFTPDTGPMHLAAWTGIKTINLSMGPVNPWETGPHAPGHLVVRAAMSCVGCWQCVRCASPPCPQPPCREAFAPARLAALARQFLTTQDPTALPVTRVPHLRLFSTAKDSLGLYALNALHDPSQPKAREAIALFWQRFFGATLGQGGPAGTPWEPALPQNAWTTLAASHPALATTFKKGLSTVSHALARALRTKTMLDAAFWAGHPPILRPLSSFLYLTLENHDYSPEGYTKAIALVEHAHSLAS